LLRRAPLGVLFYGVLQGEQIPLPLKHYKADLNLSCGKTTLARLIAKRTNAIFRELSATVVGINDVRPLFDEAKNALQLTGRCVYSIKPF